MSEVISEKDVVAAHYAYAPFGEVILQSGDMAAANSWRFSSEYAEDETATVYYNYRHYEPRMGRWLGRDPIEELAASYLIARVGYLHLRRGSVHFPLELQKLMAASESLGSELVSTETIGGMSYGIDGFYVYLYTQNNPMNRYDELGTLAPWLAGCGVGACLGGIGGAVGGVAGGVRGAVCGGVSGAVAGCASGAACAFGSPQICVYGSCVASFLGSVANTLCSQDASLKDPCIWLAAILSGSAGCIAGGTDAVKFFKLRIAIFVLGEDMSVLSGLCGLQL